MNDLLNHLEGVYSLMLTPYREDLSIDYDRYEEYADWQASQGVNHLFCVCGSSEMANLDLDERLKLAALTVKHKGSCFTVATANMEAAPDKQTEEVKAMAQTGVDGLVFTTRGLGDDPDALIEHVGKLKACTELPVFMYEFPGLQPHCISGETYGRLVNECGVVGIKDTTCRLETITEKIAQKGDSCIIQANMPYLFDAFIAGARGIMSTPTSCGGAFFARFYDAFAAGNIKEAEKRYHEIMLLDNAIDNGFNASAKYLVNCQGIKMNWINRGGTVLAPQRLRAIKAFYDWAHANDLM